MSLILNNWAQIVKQEIGNFLYPQHNYSASQKSGDSIAYFI